MLYLSPAPCFSNPSSASYSHSWHSIPASDTNIPTESSSQSRNPHKKNPQIAGRLPVDEALRFIPSTTACYPVKRCGVSLLSGSLFLSVCPVYCDHLLQLLKGQCCGCDSEDTGLPLGSSYASRSSPCLHVSNSTLPLSLPLPSSSPSLPPSVWIVRERKGGLVIVLPCDSQRWSMRPNELKLILFLWWDPLTPHA